MANILHKRKAADPSASDLTVGELAINTSDGGLFTKTSGGSVVEVGSGGGGGGSISSDNNGNTYGGSDVGSGGSENTLFGFEAGKSGTDTYETAFGYQAAKGSGTGTAYGSTAFGRKALFSITTGHYNSGIGNRALEDCTTGGNNTAFGKDAGANITTGSFNTCFGNASGDGITTGSNDLILGSNAAASSATATNEITLGDSNIATLRCQVTSITALSDRRDKTDINTLDLGLDFVNSLKPVKFKWQTRDGKGPKGYEAGFIAQDFQQVQKDNDADYLGLVLESNPDKLEATPGKLIPILVKAIQELKHEIDLLKN